LLGDPTDGGTDVGPALASSPAGHWTRADGGARLHALYRCWLEQRHGVAPATSVRFSALPPADADAAAGWEAFAADVFDFAYPLVGASDLPAWQEFLARRYRT